MLILNLVKRAIDNRYSIEGRSGVKVVLVRNHLIIYRHGERKLWIDTELKFLVAWKIRTEAEVRAFNAVLAEVGLAEQYKFYRHGRIVLLRVGDETYDQETYYRTVSRDYRHEGPGGETV